MRFRSFKQANVRRAALLCRDDPLTAAEAQELDEAQAFVETWIDKRYPLPNAKLVAWEAEARRILAGGEERP